MWRNLQGSNCQFLVGIGSVRTNGESDSAKLLFQAFLSDKSRAGNG